ncbi:hypothetical protein [Aneurinibacillus tyrosinisolvens]|uniref:hypothetical protein n=1 Tax=Aneurinibacillus tyrosinisolvens TaxID=1443435 RepID=UPI000ADDA218|nr:hypothetical protein [Aneurinibacillus tyrosinisolvens]
MGIKKESINTIKIRSLVVAKEEIKCQIINPHLSWEERAEIYKKVQLINKQIDELLEN